MPRDQYGMLGMVTTTVSLAAAVAKGGLSDGIIRFYRDYSASPDRLQMFTSTVIVRGVALASVVSVVYALCIPYVIALLGIDHRYLICFYVMLPVLFLRPINSIPLNYLRALGSTFHYNVNNLATRALGIVLSLTLLLYVTHDLAGFFAGVAAAEVASGVALFWWFFRAYSVRLDSVSKPLTFELLRFGAPLLLTELMYLLLTYIDRYLIVAICGDDQLGLYSVGYNLPSYVNDLIMFPVLYAVVPIYTDLFATKGKAATEDFLSRAFRYYLVAVIPLCAIYASVSRDLLTVLASTKYAEAATFSPIILIGLVCLGMNSMLAAGLYLQKRTKTMFGIMAASLIVNVVLNLLLLPRFAITGAAVATLIATVTSSVLTWFYARSYIRLVFPTGTIAFYLALAAAVFLVGTMIDNGGDWKNLLLMLGVESALVLVAIACREGEARAQIRKLLGAPS